MSWIKTIATGIENALNTCRPVLATIPPLLLLCSVLKRPGLSAIALTAAIIRRLPEAGIETGVNPDGSPNKTCGMVRIICEEVVKEIKDNMRIDVALPPGSITSTGFGCNGGGPMTIVSSNTLPVSGYGIGQ